MNKSQDDYLYFQKECSAKDVLKGTKTIIGIHGLEGSFTDEALHRLMDRLDIKQNQFEIKELIHSKNVIESVVSEKVDVGIFALANSGSGAYAASVEAMAEHNFKVLAIFTMKINMCIITKVNSINEVTEFRGHPVAISQCRRTLQKKWPKIPIHPDTDEMDTALSVKLLQEGEMGEKTAVFASKRAASIYDLNVVIEGAHDDPLNATSFIVIKI